MNTSRVPGVTRNTGWRAVDVEIAAHRMSQQPVGAPREGATEARTSSAS